MKLVVGVDMRDAFTEKFKMNSSKALIYLRLLVISRSSDVTNLKFGLLHDIFVAYIISLFEDYCDLEGEFFNDMK